MEREGRLAHANPLDIGCRGGRRNLWSLICPNFSPAAAHLLHVSALPVHCTAAGTFLVTHDHIRQTGHDWSGCGEQQENGDETGKAAHWYLQYSRGGHS